MEKQTNLFKAGPIHEYRFQICEKLKKLPIKTGDIVFRLDNYKYLGFISFSKLVAKVSKSKYDHAGCFFVENGEIFVLEQNDAGCNLMRLIDFLDLSAISEFSIFRLKNDCDDSIAKLSEEIKSYLVSDPDYDYSFGSVPGKFYCTQAVCNIYEKAGFKLMNPILIKNFMNKYWYYIFFVINWTIFELTKKGFDTNNGMFFVGNEQQGMMASPLIEKLLDVQC